MYVLCIVCMDIESCKLSYICMYVYMYVSVTLLYGKGKITGVHEAINMPDPCFRNTPDLRIILLFKG